MSLVTLPTEILTWIIKLTVPSGFESLLLAGSHRIYACGAQFIAAHNQRKKTWRRLYLQHHEDPRILERARWAVDFLYAVAAKDPLIPLYVEELELGYNLDYYFYIQDVAIARDRAMGVADAEINASEEQKASLRLDGQMHWQWQWPGNEWLRNDPAALQKMRDLIEGSPRLRAAGVNVEHWADKMLGAEREGDGSRLNHSHPLHIFLFILSLMDNLRKLTIIAWPWADDLRRLDFIFRDPALLEGAEIEVQGEEKHGAEETGWVDEEMEEHPELAQVLTYLVRKANNCYNRSNPPAALSRLREFRQEDEWPGDTDKSPVPLRCYSPFLSLHSLEVFSVAHTAAFEPGPTYFCSPLFQPCRPPGSSLRRIHLPYGYISPASLSRLLAHTAPRLESFSYVHLEYEATPGPSWIWDVGTFVTVLERACGETLVSLSLFAENEPPDLGAGREPITSLRGLTNLRGFRVDCSSFLRANADAEALIEGEETSDDERLEESLRERIKAVRPLRDILPPSLRYLLLSVPQHVPRQVETGRTLLEALRKDFGPSSTTLEAGASLESFAIERLCRVREYWDPDNFADFAESAEIATSFFTEIVFTKYLT